MLLQAILSEAFHEAHRAGVEIYDQIPDTYMYPEGAAWATRLTKAKHPTDPIMLNW